MATSHSRSTIFVSIPSYRDPECQYTIRDLFLKAAHPERIFVGVCWQADEEEDKRCFLLDLSEYSDRVRTKFLHHTQARGPCLARALIEQELYRGEDYYLQLDSHYRMIPNWDEELIAQLHMCRHDKDEIRTDNASNDNNSHDNSSNNNNNNNDNSVASFHRAILTTYPSSYTLPDDYEPGRDDTASLNSDRNPILLCAKSFAEDSFLRIVGKALKPEHCAKAAGNSQTSDDQAKDSEQSGGHHPSTPRCTQGRKPKKSLFWAAGLAFSSGKVLQEVPYDPNLEDLFFGEEPCMAARLWTSGWDFYAPTCIVGFHLWTRRHRPFFREHVSEERKQREAASRLRVRRLLQMEATSPEHAGEGDFGKYGLGKMRSLEEWEDFTGVSHRMQSISSSARRGGQDPSVFVNGDPAAAATNASSSSYPSAASGDPAKVLANLLTGSGFLAPAPTAPSATAPSKQAAETTKCTAPDSAKKNGNDIGNSVPLVAAPTSAFGSLPMFGAMPANVAAAIQAMAGTPAPAASTAPAKPPSLLSETMPLDLAKRLKLISLDNLNMLNRYGITVVDGLLSHRSYRHLGAKTADQSPRLVLRGAQQVPLRGAGLGAGDRVWSSTAVRGDEMTWLPSANREGLESRAEQHLRSEALGAQEKDKASLQCPKKDSDSEASEKVNVDSPYFQDLEVFLAALAKLWEELDLLGFGVQRASTMLARYPGEGARYARHLDAARDRAVGARRLTAVYYLNDDWSPDKGGCLRAFLPEAVATEASEALKSIGVEVSSASVDVDPGLVALDIEPRSDRLVLFASSWLEHEVLPVYMERYAITTWFY